MNAKAIFLLAMLGLEAAIGFCCYQAGWHLGAAHAYRDIFKLMQAGRLPFFSISPDGKSITCHVCGMTSYHPQDVSNKYCGRCHVFHEERARANGVAPTA